MVFALCRNKGGRGRLGGVFQDGLTMLVGKGDRASFGKICGFGNWLVKKCHRLF